MADVLITGCPDCLQHYYATPLLAEACASVGIEHGKSSAEMLSQYLAAFHERGHKEDGDG